MINIVIHSLGYFKINFWISFVPLWVLKWFIKEGIELILSSNCFNWLLSNKSNDVAFGRGIFKEIFLEVLIL